MKILLGALAASTLLTGCAQTFLISTEFDPNLAAKRANRTTGTNIPRDSDRAVTSLDRQDIDRLLATGGSSDNGRKN